MVNNVSTSASYVEVDETPIEDYGQDVLKLDAGKEAHDQGEPSENDGQRAVHNNSRVHIGGNKKSHILNCSVPEIDASDKCKMLALGRWKGVLTQADIPLPYLKLTDHLDYLGCNLFANYTRTRNENGNILKKKILDQIGS